MIEIERKFKLTDEAYERIHAQLEAEFGPLTPKRQIDQVFLYQRDSFEGFPWDGVVVRIRTVDGESQFTLKRSLNKEGDSIEHELTIGSSEEMSGEAEAKIFAKADEYGLAPTDLEPKKYDQLLAAQINAGKKDGR